MRYPTFYGPFALNESVDRGLERSMLSIQVRSALRQGCGGSVARLRMLVDYFAPPFWVYDPGLARDVNTGPSGEAAGGVVERAQFSTVLATPIMPVARERRD